MSYKRKAELPVGDINDLMEVTPLGAGSEVGRSCHVLKYKGKTVLVHTIFLIHMASFPSNSNKNEESIYLLPSTLFVHQTLCFSFFF